MEHSGWVRLMMCDHQVAQYMKLKSIHQLYSVFFFHVLVYYIHILELWTVFVVLKGIFVSAQIFLSADHILFCSFIAFFLVLLHATSH